ncbi:MAG: Aldo-keto reductase IolS [Phycisphaerae bacterium]|nr:Aldo-keto reductase IolS [Phycisphaerae bacterium]
MKYRTLNFGRSSLRISEIGVGCGQLFAGATDDQAAAIRRAIDLGVNLFDTADSYGDSEETLGRVLADVPRDRIVWATKFGTVRTPDGGARQDHSVAHMVRQLEQSLRRLHTDHVDIYHIHTPRRPILDDDELWAALDRAVEQGKIRTYGLSVDDNAFARDFLARTAGRSLQMKLSLFNQEVRGLLAELTARGVALLVKVPMAGGSLTDRFGPDWPGPDDDRRRRWGEEDFARRVRLVDRIRPILRAGGRTTAQGALAWLLTLYPLAIPIPGISSLKRLEETVVAAGLRLTPDEMKALDELDNGLLLALRMPW